MKFLWLIRVVGSTLIVLGLYGVLWGKNEEIKSTKTTDPGVDYGKQFTKDDIELQLSKKSNAVSAQATGSNGDNWEY